MRTPENSVKVTAGQTGIAATNSRIKFHYKTGVSTTASWCEGFLPEIFENGFESMKEHYSAIPISRCLQDLQTIGINIGHNSSSTRNAMRDAVGAAVFRTFLHEAKKPRDNLNLPKSILKAKMFIEDRLNDETLSISSLADEIGVTRQHLNSSFKKHVVITPSRYLWRLRVRRARSMLIHSRVNQSEIAFQCGFKSQPHFSRAIKQQFGMTPVELRLDMGFTQASNIEEDILVVHF